MEFIFGYLSDNITIKNMQDKAQSKYHYFVQKIIIYFVKIINWIYNLFWKKDYFDKKVIESLENGLKNFKEQKNDKEQENNKDKVEF